MAALLDSRPVDPHTGPRPLLRGLSLLFLLASGLVLVATVQLYVLTERTDRFFAWTIAEPLTAAVDGGFYLAAFTLLYPASRARAWGEVRPIAWGVLTVSTLKLGATLLDLDPFHLAEGPLTARIAGWGWLVVYVAVPIALAALIAAQLRTPGGDPTPVAPMPRTIRWVAGVLAGILVAIGVLLFAAPAATAARWPWPLTDLTARALAAWFGGIGVVAALAVLDGDLIRMRSLWWASVALAVIQGIALARYPDAFDWGSTAAWLYVGLFVAVGLAGAWAWRLSSMSTRPGR